MKKAILAAALAASLGLGLAGIASAQSAHGQSTGKYIFRVPVQGVQSPAARWKAFLKQAGVPVPTPWELGFVARAMGITSIPDASYPASTVIGPIGLSGNQLTSVNGLASLQSVGALNLSGNQLTNVNGLANLRSVTGGPQPGNLELFDNRLTSVNGLASLTSVSGDLVLSGNGLTNVNGLTGLQSVGGNLNLSNNRLTNVNGLTGLQSVGGDLNLSGNRLLVDLSGLAGITSLGGVVYLNSDYRAQRSIPAAAWLCQPAQAGKFEGQRQAVVCRQ